MGQPFSIRSLAAPRRPNEIDAPAAPRARYPERADSAAAVTSKIRPPATRPGIEYASPDSSAGSKDAFWERLLIASDIRVQSRAALKNKSFVLEPRGSRQRAA